MSSLPRTINPNDDNRPASIHAEQTILGAMLVEPLALIDAAKLDADDLSLDSHRRIFRAMIALMSANSAVDIITVANYLKGKKELANIGGMQYLYSLSEGLPRKLSIESYVHIVRKKSIMRQVMAICDTGMMEASDQSLDATDVLSQLQSRLRELSDETTSSAGLTLARDILGDETDEASPLAESLRVRDGIPYGFAKVDELTGGAQKSELIIIAARPSMGKTALLCCIAAHQAITLGKHVAVFTAEQKSEAILRRIFSARSRVDYQDIRNGTLRPYDRTLIHEQSRILRGAPLFLDDQPKPTLTRIRSNAIRLQRDLAREGRTLDSILIDQLSKFSHADLADRRAPKHERVGEITGGLKALAQELDVPIILLVQIGREGGKRADRPQLTDLKDSGNLEEDADVVLFPHRPEYYDKNDPSLAGKGEIIIAKQREGPTGVCECLYSGRIMRWEDEVIQQSAARQGGFDSERW